MEGITNVIKEIAIHVVVFVIINIIFLLLMNKSIISITSVFFYDGLIALSVAVIPVELVCFLIKKHIYWDMKDVIISAIMTTSYLFIFLSLVLVSLDRSYSVFLISYMNDYYEEGELIQKNELNEVMSKIFVDEYGMIDRRFEEQVVSGNIKEDDDYVALTEQGRKTAKMFKSIGEIYGISDKFINP